MKTITLSIEGMSCGHCISAVRSALSAVPGIASAQVTMGAATIQLADPDDGAAAATAASAANAVTDAGYAARVATGAPTESAASTAPAARPSGMGCCSTAFAPLQGRTSPS